MPDAPPSKIVALPATGMTVARLRRLLTDAAQRAIDALDDLDAPFADREDDADEDGGDDEPSLGATVAIDHRLAWGASSASVIDGESSATEDDLHVDESTDDRRRDRLACQEARARLLAILDHHARITTWSVK
jgi:hypothetical protein